MQAPWDPGQPIYRQLRDRVAAMVLDGAVGEGEPLPSVRRLAARCGVSPLTVLKGYRQLADEQLVEKRRGRGVYVRAGAVQALRDAERRRFLEGEWPRTCAAIARLGLSAEELLASARSGAAAAPPALPAARRGQR